MNIIISNPKYIDLIVLDKLLYFNSICGSILNEAHYFGINQGYLKKIKTGQLPAQKREHLQQ